MRCYYFPYYKYSLISVRIEEVYFAYLICRNTLRPYRVYQEAAYKNIYEEDMIRLYVKKELLNNDIAIIDWHHIW